MAPHQRSLFALGDPIVEPYATWDRITLDATSWIDVARGWLRGADALLDVLQHSVEWRRSRRRMYDRMVDDPRLSRHFPQGARLPHPALDVARDALCVRYGVEVGGVAFNYYRDGRDRVAPHRDRELRQLDDTLVAVLTLGARRPFLVRPLAPPRRSRDLAPGPGDLLVMGGGCQLQWEHSVPKVASCGPRISATWRWP